MILGHVTRGYCDSDRENQRRATGMNVTSRSMAETKTKARTTETAKTIESTFYGRLPGPKTRPRRGSLEAVRAPYSWGRSCL